MGAYHRVIGFTDIVVVSNDCTDGSDTLLDHLAAAGVLTHIRQTVPAGAAPQLNAAALFMASGFLKTGDWVMWLDLDEYLNVHVGTHDMNSLIDALPDADAIGVAWRVFGSAGQTEWRGEQISPLFTRASRHQWPPNTQVKTLFRYTDQIVRMHLHRPVFRKNIAAEMISFYGTDGTRLADDFIHHMMPRAYPVHRLPRSPAMHTLAQINHYAVRTPDMYSRKKTRGNGLASDIDQIDRYTDDFFAQYDQNVTEDTSILRHLDTKRAEMARLTEILARSARITLPEMP